jgi:hypothetical protein
MLNFERVADLLSGLTLIRFFPGDNGARLELSKMVASMATTETQVEWLVQRCIGLYAEWPGGREIRACFCSKFKPADGFSVGSTVYADGIPSERRIEAPALPALPPGHIATVDAGLDQSIQRLAESKDLNTSVSQLRALARRPFTAEELKGIKEEGRRIRREYLQREHAEHMAAHPIENPITQADIDAALSERVKA